MYTTNPNLTPIADQRAPVVFEKTRMNAPADGAIYSTNLIGSFLKLLPVRIEISRRAAKSMTSNSTFLSNHTELHVGVVCLFIPLRQFARSASCLVGDSVYLRCSGKVRLTPMLLFAFLFVLLTFSINSGCVSVSGPWVKYEERTFSWRNADCNNHTAKKIPLLGKNGR